MPAVDVLPTSNKVITDAVLSEKLTVPELVKIIPEFFCYSTVHYSVITARYLSLPSARSIQSTVISYLLNAHFNIILPSTQRFPSGLFSFRFPHQNSVSTTPLLSTPILSAVRPTCPAEPVLLDCHNLQRVKLSGKKIMNCWYPCIWVEDTRVILFGLHRGAPRKGWPSATISTDFPLTRYSETLTARHN